MVSRSNGYSSAGCRVRLPARFERSMRDAEEQRVLQALSEASGVPIPDLRGCGATVRLDGFELRLHASEVTLTQRGFLTVSASDLASRLGAEIRSATADEIRLLRR